MLSFIKVYLPQTVQMQKLLTQKLIEQIFMNALHAANYRKYALALKKKMSKKTKIFLIQIYVNNAQQQEKQSCRCGNKRISHLN